MCSLCRLPVAKNHNFGQFLIFGGLLYRLPYVDEGQIWCARADPRSTLTRQISSRSVSSVTKNLQILSFFWTSAFSGVASWPQSQKLSMGAQLQTFPYPTASKSCLYSHAFMAKSCAQTLTSKSVTDRHTNKQRNLNVVGRSGGR